MSLVVYKPLIEVLKLDEVILTQFIIRHKKYRYDIGFDLCYKCGCRTLYRHFDIEEWQYVYCCLFCYAPFFWRNDCWELVPLINHLIKEWKD